MVENSQDILKNIGNMESVPEIASKFEELLGIKNIFYVMLATANKLVWKCGIENVRPSLTMEYCLSDSDSPLTFSYLPPIYLSEKISKKGIAKIHEPGSSRSDLDDLSLFGFLKEENLGSITLEEVRIDEGLPVFLGYEIQPDGKYQFLLSFCEEGNDDDLIPTYYIDSSNHGAINEELDDFSKLPIPNENLIKGLLVDKKYVPKITQKFLGV